MHPVSAWSAADQEKIKDSDPVFEKQYLKFVFKIHHTGDSLWVIAEWPTGTKTAFRVAFVANDDLIISETRENDNELQISLNSIIGNYRVKLQFPTEQCPVLRYTTTFKPSIRLFIPHWPKDILFLTAAGKILDTPGTIHADQVGTRTGLLFMSVDKPKTGSLFYLQNLTALNEFCEDTRTSAGGLVGGAWPDIGFSLPQTGDPLIAGKSYIISDAFVYLTADIPADNLEMSKQFLDILALVYILLPRPETKYHHWMDTVEKGLSDVSHHKGCWTFAGGHAYLNAYLADYHTPPESMVQLAVLLPLLEYQNWKGEAHEPVEILEAGLSSFYDEKIKSVGRWLPFMEDKLDQSEEQKEARLMDSWYLHHPLLNLARMAQINHKKAEKLLLDSIDYVIKVAQHFNYQWPVFYKMDTLEVKKAETEPGEGGEKDVPGAYAHLMVETWQLTGEQRFFKEAVKAVKNLEGLGLDLFYQANNTAFTAGALLKLHKETKNQKYLDLSYVCIAAIMKNVRLWECDYGYAKHYSTFFAVFPLKDAPYTAAYEEAEVYAAFTYYLQEARDIEILPSISLLLGEFIRYFISRAPYYYPTLLPKEMLADEVKNGEIDPNAWIALEDLKDGWEKSGEVGQEVYGAGVAFGIVPRQYFKVPEHDFIIFVDYPSHQYRLSKNKSLTLEVMGVSCLKCRVIILPGPTLKQARFTLSLRSGNTWEIIQPEKSGADLEYSIPGSQKVKIEW